MYVVRLNNSNEWSESRPCTHCYHQLYRYGIKKVIYTKDTGWEVMRLTGQQATKVSSGHAFIERLLAN